MGPVSPPNKCMNCDKEISFKGNGFCAECSSSGYAHQYGKVYGNKPRSESKPYSSWFEI